MNCFELKDIDFVLRKNHCVSVKFMSLLFIFSIEKWSNLYFPIFKLTTRLKDSNTPKLQKIGIKLIEISIFLKKEARNIALLNKNELNYPSIRL
ncbi:hypothetical protein MCERE19_03034 [Spirosomataceae bacterium]